MAGFYPLTNANRDDIQRVLAAIGALVGNPLGISIDPTALIEALRQIQCSLQSPQTLAAQPDLDQPEEFLYLILPSYVLDEPVEALGLSTGATNILLREDAATIGELLEFSEQELNRIRGFGRYSEAIRDLKTALESRGLHLSRHDQLNLVPPRGDRWVKLHGVTRLRSRIGRLALDRLNLEDPPRSEATALFMGFLCCQTKTIGDLLQLDAAGVLALPWQGCHVPISPEQGLQQVRELLADVGLALAREEERE